MNTAQIWMSSMSESHLWYPFHKKVKSCDSTTWFRIWQFQTPAWKWYLQMHLLVERLVFFFLVLMIWVFWKRESRPIQWNLCRLSTPQLSFCLLVYILRLYCVVQSQNRRHLGWTAIEYSTTKKGPCLWVWNGKFFRICSPILERLVVLATGSTRAACPNFWSACLIIVLFEFHSRKGQESTVSACLKVLSSLAPASNSDKVIDHSEEYHLILKLWFHVVLCYIYIFYTDHKEEPACVSRVFWTLACRNALFEPAVHYLECLSPPSWNTRASQ
jgi:hypothetical protein